VPIFLYRHPETQEICEIAQSVHEEHVFIDSDGLKWEREFTVPNASVDTAWDANDPKDFVEKSGKKRGTMQNLWDKSSELSQKREKSMGIDPIKNQMHKDYKKLRKKDHPDVKKQKLRDSINNNPNCPITIDI